MDDPHRVDLRRREPDGEADRTTARTEPPLRRGERSPAEMDRMHDGATPGRLQEDERGRHAESPSDIPKRGWKDILWRVYNGLGEDRVLMNAAGVTFYALLALFPAIAAFVSIYGL